MKRIVLIIEYDGTNYVGWQIQPNGIAVQQVIGNALKKITGENLTLHASGRTDRGVHARAQAAHFDTESRIPAEKFAFALNTYLPPDIRIKASLEMRVKARRNFTHAFPFKRSTTATVCSTAAMPPLFCAARRCIFIPRLSIEKLNAAAELFLGTHDFAAFKATGSKAETTVRTIFLSRWSRDGDCIVYDVAGSGFLYNMVRIMVGTMLRIGQGYDDISQTPSRARMPAP